MLFERGLAYQAESMVNWDPVDNTVLANEQVDANGYSWRSGAKVEKKMLKQWFLKIKHFQKPLLEDLDALAKDGMWPERVLAMQKNWIGRSEGTKLNFDIETVGTEPNHLESVQVYTTRADTLSGVMYIALSLNHPLVRRLAQQSEPLQKFIDEAKDFPPDSKEGFLLENIRAKNPISDLLDDKNISKTIPVFVAPYVLDDYGSGAVMGVPGHDSRDFAFWTLPKTMISGKVKLDDPVRYVIQPEHPPTAAPDAVAEPAQNQPVTSKGFLVSQDPRFHSLSSDRAIEEITKVLSQAGKVAERTENWRLRDWLISRQRYWGCPIPIIHCNDCGPVPVPPSELPVKLPDLPASFFQGQKGNPLAEDKDFKNCKCPKCNKPAERETDTMDTFMDSSWYFFRFLDAHNKTELVDPQIANAAMPVDLYIGGVEHAILHLLYARFISKFLATTPVWPEGKKALGEPFKRLITQGMVHGKTYTDPATGRFLRPEEVVFGENASKPLIKGTSIVPKVSYEKMSKSKYNGVDPGATIAKYGADVTRAHMLFQAPISDVLEWDEMKITGVQRWLARVVKLAHAPWFPQGAHDIAAFKPAADLNIGVVPLLQHMASNHVLETPSSNDPKKQSTEQDLLNALHPAETALLSTTHKTITSVSTSYADTLSLNTIISDLMTLTNAISDTLHASRATPWFKWHATVSLLRMLAPIAPGVAEEGWQTLLSATAPGFFPRASKDGDGLSATAPSIFTTGFPTADVEAIPKLSSKTTCVVQINGRRKFQVEIRKAPAEMAADAVEMRRFALGELLSTEEGRRYLGKEEGGALWKESGETEGDREVPEIPRGWSMVVVKGGKLVNFVAPKKQKQKK